MEVIRPYDPLVQTAILTEECLRVEIKSLEKYRRKLNELLSEKALTDVQRENLRHIVEVIHNRNLALYG